MLHHTPQHAAPRPLPPENAARAKVARGCYSRTSESWAGVCVFEGLGRQLGDACKPTDDLRVVLRTAAKCHRRRSRIGTAGCGSDCRDGRPASGAAKGDAGGVDGPPAAADRRSTGSRPGSAPGPPRCVGARAAPDPRGRPARGGSSKVPTRPRRPELSSRRAIPPRGIPRRPCAARAPAEPLTRAEL